MHVNLIEFNWVQLELKRNAVEDDANSGAAFMTKLRAIGIHVAHLLRDLSKQLNYPTSKMEVVVDNIAAEIAHECMPFSALIAHNPVTEHLFMFLVVRLHQQIVAQQMLSFGMLVDKMLAYNPQFITSAMVSPDHRLNVDDANLVEIVLSRDSWLYKMGSKPLGHLVYYVTGVQDGLDIYRYGAECIRDFLVYPAYPCQTFEQAVRAKCPAVRGFFMGGEPNRTPSLNGYLYKGQPTRYFLVPSSAPAWEDLDAAFDTDVTFKCIPMQYSESAQNLLLNSATGGSVLLEGFDLKRRTVVLLHGLESGGVKFNDEMLAGNFIFNLHN